MKRTSFKILTLLLIFIKFLKATSLQEDECAIVELSHGKLRGRDRDYYYSYESIPYAEPPIGELRFESPKPYAQRWKTVFDATQPPKACIQLTYTGELQGEEDCLTMNVYRPKQSNGTTLLPVFVHIHGGGFMFGATQVVSETYLMRSGRFVMAKFTYRVGPMGFLSTDDEVLPGNYGLKDQRLALQWIKDNIVYFGGDPKRILVTGFSSGGASVHYHLLQPDFKSIAKAAVSFSGTALLPWTLMSKARMRAFKMARNLKCDKQKTSRYLKECLQTRSATDIVLDVKNFFIFGYSPFTTFGPVVEPVNVKDAFLKQLPAEIIRSGNYSSVPWLVTYVPEDGSYNAAELLRKTPNGGDVIDLLNELWYEWAPYILFFKDTVANKQQSNAYARALKDHYLGAQDFSEKSYLDVQRIYTDLLYKHGIQQVVELHKNSKAPVYAYRYENPSDNNFAIVQSNRTDFHFGTSHGDDLALIMPSGYFSNNLREDQLVISKKFIKMLADFVLGDGNLKYDTCHFINNVGQKQLALMFITKDSCQNKNLDNFP